jgi:DNA-binding response OmpR family regulator
MIINGDNASGAATERQTNRRHRILVVDDDGTILEIIVKGLAASGYLADSSRNGAAAWQALQNNQYDLLITDNKMPKVTGIELVQKLRCAGMTLPVVLMSGDLPQELLDRNSSLQLTALVKPFAMKELLEIVKKSLDAAENITTRNDQLSEVE